MKKLLSLLLALVVVIAIVYYAVVYFFNYSEGTRSGELIKFSKKGFVFKTWEGELSQGVSGAQIFEFSVHDHQEQIIEQFNKYQGGYVKLHYEEKLAKVSFWGDTKYFITKVEKIDAPHLNRWSN